MECKINEWMNECILFCIYCIIVTYFLWHVLYPKGYLILYGSTEWKWMNEWMNEWIACVMFYSKCCPPVWLGVKNKMSRLKCLKRPQVYYNNGNQGCTVSCSLMRKVFILFFLYYKFLPAQCKTFLVSGLQ